MRMRGLCSSILPVIAVIFLSAAARPQQASPATHILAGTIADQMNVPIAKAHVWVHKSDGETSFSTTTDSQGRFSLNLTDGYYDVMFSAPGFAPSCKVFWSESDGGKTLKIRLRPDEEHLQQQTRSSR